MLANITTEDELKQKIATEMIEIDRLNEEIAEYEELRSITTLGNYRIIRYHKHIITLCLCTLQSKL